MITTSRFGSGRRGSMQVLGYGDNPRRHAMKPNTSERLARYETAQFAIGMMVALRAAWIAKEREQPNPDQAAVDLWVEEQGQLSEEGLALMLDDLEGIERVINEYGPVVRAALAEA